MPELQSRVSPIFCFQKLRFTGNKLSVEGGYVQGGSAATEEYPAQHIYYFSYENYNATDFDCTEIDQWDRFSYETQTGVIEFEDDRTNQGSSYYSTALNRLELRYFWVVNANRSDCSNCTPS